LFAWLPWIKSTCFKLIHLQIVSQKIATTFGVGSDMHQKIETTLGFAKDNEQEFTPSSSFAKDTQCEQTIMSSNFFE